MVVAVLAIAGWLSRDLWWERATGRVAAPAVSWAGPNAAAAPVARRQVEALRAPKTNQPVVLNAEEVASYLAAGDALPIGAAIRNVQVSLGDGVLGLKGIADLASLRVLEGVGGLAPMLGGTQPVVVLGRPRVARPGLATMEITRVTIGGIEVPKSIVGKLLSQVAQRRSRGADPGADLPAGMISFSIPKSVADLRVEPDRLIFYPSIK